jgi:hypothetical protein
MHVLLGVFRPPMLLPVVATQIAIVIVLRLTGARTYGNRRFAIVG